MVKCRQQVYGCSCYCSFTISGSLKTFRMKSWGGFLVSFSLPCPKQFIIMRFPKGNLFPKIGMRNWKPCKFKAVSKSVTSVKGKLKSQATLPELCHNNVLTLICLNFCFTLYIHLWQRNSQSPVRCCHSVHTDIHIILQHAQGMGEG